MTYAQDTEQDEILGQLSQTAPFDWKGRSLKADDLALALRTASEKTGAKPLSLLNARINGHLRLDAIGQFGEPLAFQMLNCVMNGSFAARQSRWVQLVIGHCKLQDIDLPASEVERHLLIERVEASGWLELRGTQIGQACSLNGSNFKMRDRACAIRLDNARIGGSLTGMGLAADGGLDATRIRIDGDLGLDGAHLTAGRNGHALGLSQARIGGLVRLCQAGDRRFVTKGRVHLDRAEIDALMMTAASLDGLGEPTIVADELRVERSVDLGGSGTRAGFRFEADGELRFGAARIGGQFQIYGADLRASGKALLLQGAHVGGDVLLGHETVETTISGTIDLSSVRLGSRLVGTRLRFTEIGDALAVRQSAVSGNVELYDIQTRGPVRLDNLTAGGASIERIHLDRDLPDVDLTGRPETYAHAEHALLDLSFVRLTTDLRLEDVYLRGGDLRMVGASVGATAQISMIEVTETAGAAVMAQSAKIGAGFLVAGSPDRPASFTGDFSAMGLETGEGLTFAHVRFSSPERKVSIVLQSARIRSGVILANVELEGALIAGAATIGGDVRIENSRILCSDDVILDFRGASVAGKLQVIGAGKGITDLTSRLAGHATLEGSSIGTLEWDRVAIGDGSILQFSNIAVTQRISAGKLMPEGRGHLSLASTTTPLLEDELGDDEDSWGAGRLTLDLDDFNYGRLVYPSGRNSDDPETIRFWRAKWFRRRQSEGSPRPLRHLANTLRTQGLVEASRLQLVDAFSAEGRFRPTWAGRGMTWLFGALFGHGLSGSRAAATLLAAWLLGAAGVVHLQNHDLLVAAKPGETPLVACVDVDPLLFAADAMLPLDLGANTGCVIGMGRDAALSEGALMEPFPRKIFGEIELYRFGSAVYQLLSWIFISLAVLTWSGLLKRGGRD